MTRISWKTTWSEVWVYWMGFTAQIIIYTGTLDVCYSVFTAFTWEYSRVNTKFTVNMWHLPVVSGIGTCSSSKKGVSLWT